MRADRLFSIVLMLQAHGRMTAQEMAEELEVSERTLYRDLDALSLAGIPIYADKGPGGGYALLEGYRATLTGLTEAEASTLFLSSVSEPLAALGLDKTLNDAMLKLLAALPRAPRERVERERARIHLDPAPWFQGHEELPYLPLLQQAVWEDRQVEIVYERGDGQQVERTVDPYGLVAKASWWYLAASTPDGMRVYRISRIHNARFTGRVFKRPDDFDLAAFWKQAQVEFAASRSSYQGRLRVAPQLVGALPPWREASEPDGVAGAGRPDQQDWLTVWAEFERFEWAVSRVLGWGAWAEALEPPELREAVVETLRKAAAMYEASRQ